MNFKLIESNTLQDVKIIRPECFNDERGFFFEGFKENVFAEQFGITDKFVQDNFSRSIQGVKRGLHYQPGMSKLMRVIRGKAILFAMDIRLDSSTFGKWEITECSDENKIMVYAPSDFARGFVALSEIVDIHYKCSDYYNSGTEGVIKFDFGEFIMSDRDKKALTLEEWREKCLSLKSVLP